MNVPTSSGSSAVKRSKILHYYPDHYGWGGIEAYLVQTLSRLSAEGSDEIVAVCTASGRLFQALTEAGVRVLGVPFPLKRRGLISSWFRKPLIRTLDWTVRQHLEPILRMESPNLVHLHSGRLEHAWIQRDLHIPLAYTYHGYGVVFNIESAPTMAHRVYYKLMRPLFRRLLPHLSGMTIVSEYEKARLYREGFIPRSLQPSFEPKVIYNGVAAKPVSAEERDQLKAQLGIPEGCQVISLVSRLDTAKNVVQFLEVAREILARQNAQLWSGGPVYFLVAGDGSQAHHFRDAFAYDPVLKGQGQWLGFRNDVPAIFALSDLTVSTATQEGFGLRVIEAFRQGCPFAGYAVGGQIEVIPEHWRGRSLSPLGDVTAMIHNIEVLLQTHYNSPHVALEERMQLQHHSQQFSMRAQLEGLAQFYQEILAK